MYRHKSFKLSEMVKRNSAAGYHWFSKGTMEFFNSVIEAEPNKYNLFISSERMNQSDPKKYTIRYFNPNDNTVQTIGNFHKIDSLEEAEKFREIICSHWNNLANRENYVLDNLSNTKIEENIIYFETSSHAPEGEAGFGVSLESGKICY